MRDHVLTWPSAAILDKCCCLLILLLLLARLQLWSKALRMSLLHQTGQSGSTQQGQSAAPVRGTGLFQLTRFSPLLPDNELASTTFMPPSRKHRLWVMEMSIHCGTVSPHGPGMIAGDLKYPSSEQAPSHQRLTHGTQGSVLVRFGVCQPPAHTER